MWSDVHCWLVDGLLYIVHIPIDLAVSPSLTSYCPACGDVGGFD